MRNIEGTHDTKSAKAKFQAISAKPVEPKKQAPRITIRLTEEELKEEPTPTPGCFKSGLSDTKRYLGDLLLFGLSLVALAALRGARRR